MSDDEEEIESMDTGDTSLTSPGSDNTTLHAPNTPATPATPSAPPTTDLEKASSVNSRDEAEDEDEVLEGENKDDDRRVSRAAAILDLFLRGCEFISIKPRFWLWFSCAFLRL